MLSRKLRNLTYQLNCSFNTFNKCYIIRKYVAIALNFKNFIVIQNKIFDSLLLKVKNNMEIDAS